MGSNLRRDVKPLAVEETKISIERLAETINQTLWAVIVNNTENLHGQIEDEADVGLDEEIMFRVTYLQSRAFEFFHLPNANAMVDPNAAENFLSSFCIPSAKTTQPTNEEIFIVGRIMDSDFLKNNPNVQTAMVGALTSKKIAKSPAAPMLIRTAISLNIFPESVNAPLGGHLSNIIAKKRPAARTYIYA